MTPRCVDASGTGTTQIALPMRVPRTLLIDAKKHFG